MMKAMTPRLQAVEEAVLAYEEIREACTRPDKAILGKTLEIYKELADWGFIDKYKITESENKWLYVVIIAMHLSRENNCVTSSDSYIKQDQKGKWQIIQLALERANKEKALTEEKENKRPKKRA